MTQINLDNFRKNHQTNRNWWVYKIRASKKNNYYRWDNNFFSGSGSISMSGEDWASFGNDVDKFRSLTQGDLVLAHQIEDKNLIGIAEIVNLRIELNAKKDPELIEWFGMPVVEFPKHVPIHRFRHGQDRRSALNQIKAFQDRGTLHYLSEADAEIIFEICVNYQHGTDRAYQLINDLREIRRLIEGQPSNFDEGDWL